jgi:hypothetical protein
VKVTLPIAVALYAVAVAGIGAYVYVDSIEGVAHTFGYSIGQMALVGIVTMLVTRRANGWTASRRFATILFWTTGLLIAFHVPKVTETFRLRSLREELGSANSPEQIASILDKSTNPVAQFLRQMIEHAKAGAAEVDAAFYELEADPSIVNSLQPSTLADPAAFRESHSAIRQWLAGMEAWRARVQAAVRSYETDIKRSASQVEGVRDDTRRAFISGFERTLAVSHEFVSRRLDLDERLLIAIDEIYSFLESRHSRYEITEQQVVFGSSEDADRYNELAGEVEAISEELDNLGAEIERRKAEWTDLQWLRQALAE